MELIFKFILFVFLSFLLVVVIRQSYNLIFFILRRPVFWITFMFGLGIFYFWVGSMFDNSFNIIWWSALAALLVNLPPKFNPSVQEEVKEAANSFFSDVGISRGTLKYRIGLVTYAVGASVGWIIFYGQVVSIS